MKFVLFTLFTEWRRFRSA